MIQVLLATVITVVGVYSVYAGFKYTRMIATIFMSLKYNPPTEASLPGFGEKISILDSSGQEIRAVLLEKTSADRLVIFCHDSGSSMESWEKYASFFPELGFSVLSIDFQNSLEETGVNPLSQWPVAEEVERLKLAIRWARNAWKPGLKILLFGVSKGANIALAASIGELQVRGVVTDGLFSMKEIFRDYIRRWGPILVKPNLFGENYPNWLVNIFTDLGFWYSQKKSKRFFVDTEKILTQNHPPLLMIHGAQDDYISSTHQAMLYRLQEKGNNPFGLSQHFQVDAAGHNEAVLLDQVSYRGVISEFIKKVL